MGSFGKGFMSAAFGESYRPFGAGLRLPRTGLQLIKRPITGKAYDLIGVYPYVMCSDWSGLNQDIDELRDGDAVSVVFVADPFQSEVVRLAAGRWEHCQHFKSHHVVDLAQDWHQARSKEDRRVTRRVLEAHEVEVVADPVPMAEALWALYQTTLERKNVTGMQRLSLATIQQQLAIEGALLVAAHDPDGLAGAMLSYDHGETSVCHLMFLSDRAHHNKTTYALIYSGLVELEKRGCRFANLGGPAGNDDDATDGLVRFKSRWTKTTRSALICGAILNPDTYRLLEAKVNDQSTGYFPSYRAPGGPFVPI